jgi:hypothetical protein
MRLISTAAVTMMLLPAACDGGPGRPVPELPEPRQIDVPAAAGAGQPNLTAWADRVLMSWIEPVADGGHALRFAAWDGARWSEPGTIASGTGWFVNWADFPAMVALSETQLAAHWLQRSGPGRYAYDVMLSQSADAGATWSPPLSPHRDGTETEHGFVSLFDHDGDIGIVWLDGRHFEAGAHEDPTNEMMVRFTTLAADGTLADEVLLDQRACDCCQTAVALTARGPVVAYRDRSAEEVRDIAVVRLVDGEWTPPRTLHEDGWSISGCPVNGPAAHAAGDDVVVAWFTAAAGTPRVNVAFSADAGASFGPAIRVDGGDPVGRVDVLLLPSGHALVIWLENVGEVAEVRARLVARGGRPGAPRTVAATGLERASCFPRLPPRGDEVVVGWTEPGDPSHVRAAVLQLPRR